MSSEFLETRLDDLGEVASLVLFGNADGLFNLALFEATGNRRCKFPGLLPRLN